MQKNKLFMGALLLCTMFGISSCDDIGANYDNPTIGSYMKVDEAVTVGIGKTVSINPSTISDGNVLFTSSNDKVATVDANGNVTGHMSGNVQITATVEETKGYYSSTAYCNVQVCAENTEQFEADINAKKDAGYWTTIWLAPEANIELPDGLTLPNVPLEILGDEEKPATIKINKSITIQNTFNLLNVIVDASELDKPFVQLAKTESESYYYINQVYFNNVKVNDLKYQFFYGNMETKCLINNFNVQNSVIGIDGTNKKCIFDFNSSGNYGYMYLNNSTFYANPPIEKAGSFINTQSATKISTFGITDQTTNIQYCTFYNISYKERFCSQVENNRNYLYYNVYCNIFVNCGKSGQLYKGLGGNASNLQPNTNWNVGNNMINFDGEDTSSTELIGNYTSSNLYPITGVVSFADAAHGDFHQSDTWVGDQRWRVDN